MLMMMRRALHVALAGALGAHAAAAAPVSFVIDPAASRLDVHTKKAGLFARLGHAHHVRASSLEGTVRADRDAIGSSALELMIPAGALRVIDGGLAESDRHTVQSNMLSSQVLDAARFPVIRYRSRTVTGAAAGPGKWNVSVDGVLALHGQESPVQVVADVTIEGDRLLATGELRLSQRAFGIKPFRAALGAVGVADEVRIVFQVLGRSTEAAPPSPRAPPRPPDMADRPGARPSPRGSPRAR